MPVIKTLRLSRLMALSAFVIFTAAANAQTLEIDKAKAGISELLKTSASVLKTADKDSPNYDPTVRSSWGTEKNIFVSEDRIEFRRKKESTVFLFSDLNKYKIHFTTDQSDNSGVVLEEFLIMLKGRVNGRKLADDLLIIQNHLLNQELEKQYPPLTLFEPVAANYRELKIKPQISEEERKYIVQANSFNEEKNYSRAIELYIKAIEIDQTAFPAAYLNLALLSAQMKEYYPAVYYMKKYLLLIPDAPDARAAQDNIYIWEGKMGK